METADYLKKLYYDVSKPGAFSGPDKPYKVVKRYGKHRVSLKKIKQWLND